MAQKNSFLQEFVKCTSAQYDAMEHPSNRIYLKTAQSLVLDKVYPIGSIYTSLVDVSPSSFLGGRWLKIDDGVFMRSATAGVAENTQPTGGSDAKPLLSHTHSYDHTHPSHTHGIGASGSTNTEPDHAHGWNEGLGGAAFQMAKPSGSGNFSFDGGPARTGEAGAHNHTATIHGSLSSVALSYTGESAATGNGETTNLPVYKSAYMWLRVG